MDGKGYLTEAMDGLQAAGYTPHINGGRPRRILDALTGGPYAAELRRRAGVDDVEYARLLNDTLGAILHRTASCPDEAAMLAEAEGMRLLDLWRAAGAERPRPRG